MKNARFTFLIAMALLVLQSCTPDTVNPKTGPSAQASWEEAVHELPGEICGPSVSLKLALPNGDPVVGYCGSFGGNPLPCPAPSALPNWGAGVTANMRTQGNEDIVMVEMTLAPSWFIASCAAKIGDPESFGLDQNGVPMVDATWNETGINPLVNNWKLTWNLGPHTSQQCVAFAAKITVAKLNFFNPVPDPLSVTELWVYNEDYNNPATPEMMSPSALITPWCLYPCPGDVVVVDPSTLCENFPSLPEPACTQTAGNGAVNINNPSAVVCVPGNRNIGSVNFHQAGTVVIPQGAVINGGINANNGGTLIVDGTFNWNNNANINGNFKIYVTANGTLNRSNDLTMNNQNNLMVNLGTVNIGSNLTYIGRVYNGGVLNANGINVNSGGSKLVNSGSITSNNFVNVNNGTTTQNCGSIKVGNNLEINGGSTLVNYCSIEVDNVTHANGTFEHYGTLVSGKSGSADGFSIQGPTTLHDNSTILTRNFFWSANQPLVLDGNATILVANSTMSSVTGQVTSLSGSGKLRMSGGSVLAGNGSLVIADIDPISSGDNPTAPNVAFPSGLKSLVAVPENTSLLIRALNPTTDIPTLCN